MSPSQDYYKILQVKSTADLDTIKRAYRDKIRRYHPDQFAGELAKLKETGNLTAVRKLEAELVRSQQMTQRINEAYGVLSDQVKRTRYDQYLSDERQRQYNQEIRRQRMQHWEVERRTVKSRPHSANPNMRRQTSTTESVPWAMLVGLIVIVLFVAGLFSNAVTRNHTPFTTYVPSNPTSEGSLRAFDLQATTNAERATIIARSTLVFEPTSTPRSASANETLGDRFMSLDKPERAVSSYTDAILADSENAILYVKRATAYVTLYNEGNVTASELALADYTQAIDLDNMLADAVLARGILYYELWLVDGEYGEEARSDLEHYLQLTSVEDDETIQAILSQLP